MNSPNRQPSFDAKDIAAASELVGKFFYHWGLLETLINDHIAKLFGIGEFEGHIITANIAFRDKLHIIHTALIWEGRVHTEDWRRKARKTAGRIGRLANQRNFLAHTSFTPTKDGFVRFHSVQAKGELGFPTVYWAKADFNCKYDLIRKAILDLESLGSELSNRKALIAALLAQQQPNRGLFGLSSLYPPYHPAQSPLDSLLGITNPDKGPRTDPSGPE